MKITISYATQDDLRYLKANEKNVNLRILKKKLADKEIIIAKDKDAPVGWLRFGYFWDLIPFMNMIMLEDEYREKGIGTKLVTFWEKEMKKNKFSMVMTSTQDNETAQNFYRKLGYKDAGAISDINDDGSKEIILIKKL